MTTASQSKHESDKSDSKMEKLLIGLGGLGFGLWGAYILSVSSEDTGRGEEIQDCPDEYTGIVEVTNVSSLESLASIAIDESIKDSFSDVDTDNADKPGELACYTPIEIGGTSKKLVLLPSGLDALDRGRSQPMAGQLPDGLVWISEPKN